LIAAAENRIRQRRKTWSVLKVEADTERVRKFYERLGYGFSGRESAAWEVDDEEGRTRMYETELVVLRKELLAGN